MLYILKLKINICNYCGRFQGVVIRYFYFSKFKNFYYGEVLCGVGDGIFFVFMGGCGIVRFYVV